MFPGIRRYRLITVEFELSRQDQRNVPTDERPEAKAGTNETVTIFRPSTV